MKASGASLLFEQKGVPFHSVDAIFEGLKGVLEDGFVIARGKDALRYFFVIQGKPYISAVIEGDKTRVASMEDFFLWYRGEAAADIEVYKADKKVLLCLLVRLNYGPALSFTTDKMAPEEVIENMEGRGKDAVIAVSDAGGDSDLWHFVIFVGGKVAYTTLLSEETTDESPADRLISYIMHTAKGIPLLVEIYIDTKIAPAADAKEFEEGSIVEQYLGTTPEAEAATGLTPEAGFMPEAGIKLEPEVEIDEAGAVPLEGEVFPSVEMASEEPPETAHEAEEDVEPSTALEQEAEQEIEEVVSVSEAIEKEPSEEAELGEEDFLEEPAPLAADEAGVELGGSGEEFLEELPEELAGEEPITEDALTDEFAELSMEELSETFDEQEESEEGGLEAGADEGTLGLTGNEALGEDVVEDESVEETLPEAEEDELGVSFTGSEPEDVIFEDELVSEDEPVLEPGGEFTLEDKSPIAEDEEIEFPDEEIIEEEGDAEQDSAFDMEDAVAEDTGDEFKGDLVTDDTGADAEEQSPAEELVETPEAAPEELQESLPEEPTPEDATFTPLPIEDDMGQRQPKGHPLSATLTAKDGTEYTLGSITNIGKEDGSEIKLEGMLAAKKLASIIRGKDFFTVVKKGGGKSALKVNGAKVEGELELKDGDVIDAGNLSLKLKVTKD